MPGSSATAVPAARNPATVATARADAMRFNTSVSSESDPVISAENDTALGPHLLLGSPGGAHVE
ncbi:hypothetical protein GCM10009837_35580 [Streptomyces durmitorensis]